MPWWRDRPTLYLLAATMVPRYLTAGIWAMDRCFRDECMYLFTAERMAQGLGMTSSNGWLWAPGWVAVLALFEWLFTESGVAVVPQVLLTGLGAWLVRDLGRRVVGERGATVAAWMYALSPTFIYLSGRLWSETVYSVLLLAALRGVLVAREAPPDPSPSRSLKAAAWPGFLVGLCVLMRGVATYMMPIFALGLVWGRLRQGRAWLQGLVLVAVTVATVTPYSLYATRKFGTFIVSDKTVGQMMWLGDNDFPPVTFDFGNGLLSDAAYNRVTSQGRPHCAPKEQPIERDRCETANGLAWIRANPQEFVRRIPLRLAQTLNPNSFLTRHLRQGYWAGLPDRVDDLLCVLVVAVSLATVLGGALGAWARGPSVYLLVVGLTTAYHLAAIACLAGLTRYRVPLDTLWLVYAGAFLASPAQAWRALRSRPWRLAGALVCMALLLPLMLWFLPAGFPGWGAW